MPLKVSSRDISRNELVTLYLVLYLKLDTSTLGLYTCAIPTEMDLTQKMRFVDVKIPKVYDNFMFSRQITRTLFVMSLVKFGKPRVESMPSHGTARLHTYLSSMK